MTDPKEKKLSRRDAIKLLGAAAGATLLANLPSKWSKPEVAGSVLPAHAQTSFTGPVTFSSVPQSPLGCNGTLQTPFNPIAPTNIPVTFQAIITPQIAGIMVPYQLVPIQINVQAIPLNGMVTSGIGGLIAVNAVIDVLDAPNSLTNTFSSGPNSCIQTIQLVDNT
jgi:hypothetical protein